MGQLRRTGRGLLRRAFARKWLSPALRTLLFVTVWVVAGHWIATSAHSFADGFFIGGGLAVTLLLLIPFLELLGVLAWVVGQALWEALDLHWRKPRAERAALRGTLAAGEKPQSVVAAEREFLSQAEKLLESMGVNPLAAGVGAQDLLAEARRVAEVGVR